jgi:peptidoglycan hydrolase CwlO-like protein
MRRVIATAVVALALIGCDSKSPREKLGVKMIDTMQEYVDVLKTVKDESSLNAAKPKIQDINKRMEAMGNEIDKLGSQTAEEEKAMKEKYGDKMKAVVTDMGNEMMRIQSNPTLAAKMDELNPGMGMHP